MASMPLFGVYVGNEPDHLARFEAWAGRDVDIALGFVDMRSWHDIAHPGWLPGYIPNEPILWSMPLTAVGTPLSEVASGAHNADFRSAAAEILATATADADGKYQIRVGWEANGTWNPWSAGGQEETFAEAFRQLVRSFRDVGGDRFEFEFNFTYGQNADIARMYPGDNYVDVVGIDAYWDPNWLGSDPVAAFAHIKTPLYGLDWAAEFARAHGKALSVSEWGVPAGHDATPYLELFAAWMAEAGVDRQFLWDSNAAYPGEMSDGSDATSGAAYKRLFVEGQGYKSNPVGSPGVPAAVEVGTGPNTLVLKVSQEHYQGNAQYVVKVDGAVVGGTFTASALHASGQSDTLTIKGDWAAGPHSVSVTFLNDAYGGSATTDRNLYVDGMTYNGVAVPGTKANLLSTNSTGTFRFEATAPTTGPAPTSTTIGSGPDALVLKINQDAWKGDAQYTISVDGQQIGGTLTAKTLKSSGQAETVTVRGDWGAGSHAVSVKFLNDLWGGTPDTDRNLFVESATYNGAAVPGAKLALYSPGAKGFAFEEASASSVIGSGSHSLVLKVSQDHYRGDAQYTVSVDGVQIGGVLTAKALHGSGQSDAITVKGDWGPGNHTLEVEFLNDAWDGTPETDRNLHIDGVTYDGTAIANGTTTLWRAGQADFVF